jgi:hypothetical protein
MKNYLFLLITLSFSSGCNHYSIRNIGKPPPARYEGWVNPDGSKVAILEAKKALLECGSPSPSPHAMIYEKALGIADADELLNHSAMVSGCMEKSGLRRRWTSLQESCKWYKHYSTFPACQPNATFADRSVERRLNSWHCRLKTSYAFCLDNAVNPAMCDKERDHRPPPPECQP